MKSTSYAIVFPGQGSQVVGMGQTFFEIPAFQQYFKTAATLGMELVTTMLNGPQEALTQTRMAQPALMVLEVAIYSLLKERLSNNQPLFMAGHSLGEYTALIATGALSFEQGLLLVIKRAELMQQACQNTLGSMAALLRADRQQVERLCQEPQYHGKVVIGNYNSPDQLVLSGDQVTLAAMSNDLKKMGIRRILPLKVSGAFHSPLMAEAEVGLAQAIENAAFNDSQIPVVSNVDAKPTTQADAFKSKLKKQLTAPVLWEDSIHWMANQGVRHFIEVGPGKVLARLIQQTVPDAIVDTISTREDLERLIHS